MATTDPLYIFNNLSEDGIYATPINSFILILNNNNKSTIHYKLSNGSLKSTATVQEFINCSECWEYRKFSNAILNDEEAAIQEAIDSGAIGSGGEPSQLEKITEGGNTGYRILGSNVGNHGNIGNYAVDLSFNVGGYSTTSSGATSNYSFASGYEVTASGYASYAEGYYTTASGYISHAEGYYTTASGDRSHAEGGFTTASGNYSHAEGGGTTASGNYSHAEGKFNSYYTYVDGTPANDINYDLKDLISVVGIGTNTINRANGFEVHTTGLVKAPQATISIINSDDKSLTTKEYVDSVVGGAFGTLSELEKITEGGNTGWRILGRDPLNYGDIGSNAVDLSFSNIASTTHGATGNYSVAEGYNTIASGIFSHAEGWNTIASGIASHAEGYSTIASGGKSHAEGYLVEASGDRSHAEGALTIAFNDYMHVEGILNDTTPSPTLISATGIGTFTARANGFEVHTTGLVKAPEATIAVIDSDDRALTTKEYVDASKDFLTLNNLTDASSVPNNSIFIETDVLKFKNSTGIVSTISLI